MSRFRLTISAGLFLSALLGGCGGGGGGGGGGSAAPVYKGSTSQAIVTTSNAKALSVDAYSGSQISAAVSGVAKEAADGSGQSSLLLQTAGIMEASVTRILGMPRSTAKVVAATAQDTVQGFSGSFSYSINFDQNTGAFNGTVSFSQYLESATSVAISGPIAFSGSFNQSAGTFTSLNISMSNLNGTSGNKSYSLAGNLAYSTSIGTKNVTMSVVLTDNVSSNTYWVKDFILTLAGNSLTMIGTYYDHVHGYVVISTIAPLTVPIFDATPTSGQLLFTGANGTKARLTFTVSGHIVEADTAGNGAYVVVP